MTTINDTYINALLADATYVDNLNLAVTPGDLATALKNRMTQPLADFIAANFTVVTQKLSANGGFDATVWRGNTGTPYAGQTYVSMRGTQQLTDFIVDVDLALTGLAHGQINAANDLLWEIAA